MTEARSSGNSADHRAANAEVGEEHSPATRWMIWALIVVPVAAIALADEPRRVGLNSDGVSAAEIVLALSASALIAALFFSMDLRSIRRTQWLRQEVHSEADRLQAEIADIHQEVGQIRDQVEARTNAHREAVRALADVEQVHSLAGMKALLSQAVALGLMRQQPRGFASPNLLLGGGPESLRIEMSELVGPAGEVLKRRLAIGLAAPQPAAQGAFEVDWEEHPEMPIGDVLAMVGRQWESRRGAIEDWATKAQDAIERLCNSVSCISQARARGRRVFDAEREDVQELVKDEWAILTPKSGEPVAVNLASSGRATSDKLERVAEEEGRLGDLFPKDAALLLERCRVHRPPPRPYFGQGPRRP